MPARFALLVLVPLILACGRKDRAEPSEEEAVAAAPAPSAESAEERAEREVWVLHVEKVEYTDGNLAVLAAIASPTSAKGSVERVFVGASVRKPDGTVVDAPLVEVGAAEIAGAQSLSHTFGPGFSEFALGVWGQAPPPCEEGQEDCAPRLEHLADALAVHPKQDSAIEGLQMGKLDTHIGVSFRDAGGTAVMKAVRKATFSVVGTAYRDPRFRISQVGGGKAPRDGKIAVRHRDLSDTPAATQVAAELRKVVAGTEVVVEHAPELDVEFTVVVGGTGTITEGYEVDAGPVRMVRPGRDKPPPPR
jgi:hypothetical protein